MFQTSYSSIILETSEENLYLVDIDSEVNYHHLMNVRTDNLPYEYIPVPDKLYDYEPQNSEPEFIKKLESYGQHANTGDGSFCLRRDEDVRYIVEDLNPVVSAWLTIRNVVGGFVKKVKFVERV